MSLSRVKTWNPGDVLTAADLNGEFNNVLNNPISLVSPTTGPINFNSQINTNLFGSPLGSRVKGLIGTLSSQNGTFSADQYLLQTADGKTGFELHSTASFTVSIGTAGPAVNGRDQAAAFASTYVHWYAITTGPGSITAAGIVSTVPPPTGPTLPAGYSGWTYLGASVYTSASTTMPLDHAFRGNTAYYTNGVPLVVTAGTASVDTPVSVSTAVPANALGYECGFLLNTISSATANFVDVTLTLKTSVGASAMYNAHQGIISGANYNMFFPLPNLRFPQNSTQSFQYALTIATGTSANVTASVVNYSMPNGA